VAEAIASAENDGIIFVDEIDKICTPSAPPSTP
jgi:ATP-dependent protease HslVU (ClpYQ) ATPase subunit